MKLIAMTLLCLLIAGGLSCQKKKDRQPDTNYNPVISPANFSRPTELTNPYLPYVAGKTYVYEGQTSDGFEHIEEQRLSSTKTIMGITCIEVEFKGYLNGKLVEKTIDWYAQDNDSTVWYFGEAVDNYDASGNVKNHSSAWQAGLDGAKPGIMMQAKPFVGQRYREEYYFNNAEDEAEVLAIGETVTIPFNTFSNCLKTKNFTALEPNAVENKYYAPGVGLVKEVTLSDRSETVLVAIK